MYLNWRIGLTITQNLQSDVAVNQNINVPTPDTDHYSHILIFLENNSEKYDLHTIIPFSLHCDLSHRSFSVFFLPFFLDVGVIPCENTICTVNNVPFCRSSKDQNPWGKI
jgi:hypothetical protein